MSWWTEPPGPQAVTGLPIRQPACTKLVALKAESCNDPDPMRLPTELCTGVRQAPGQQQKPALSHAGKQVWRGLWAVSGDARRADASRGQGKSEGTPQGRDKGNPTQEQCDKAASNQPARKHGSVTQQSDPPVLKPRLTAILQKTHTSGPKLYPLSAAGQGHTGGPKDPPQPRLQPSEEVRACTPRNQPPPPNTKQHTFFSGCY